MKVASLGLVRMVESVRIKSMFRDRRCGAAGLFAKLPKFVALVDASRELQGHSGDGHRVFGRGAMIVHVAIQSQVVYGLFSGNLMDTVFWYRWISAGIITRQ